MSNARELAEFAAGYGSGSFAVGKNKIINGAMTIDQRNAGASVTPTNGQYTLDRWFNYQSVSSKYSIQQSSTAPAGFVNSFSVTSLSAYTPSGSEIFAIVQAIEGLNVADLGWGSADAKTVTLSFWVRSSLTGTFGGSIFNSGFNRSYPFTYTISSADTWEKKAITIAGDTTGTWLKNNLDGMKVLISLGAGSSVSGTAGSWAGANYFSATGATSVVGTSGATFYITGVQLEEGSVATPFENRLYGQELALCQRYYYSWSASGLSDNYYLKSPYVSSAPNSSASVGYFFPVIMRANPTMVGFGGLTLNRFTSNQAGAVAQIGSSSSATAYSLSSFTASAEL